ncbi:hypothetical protein EON63_13745 [archaeon]|nr:MAG: hypothetical protein EON63_13745 [archaeon]
MAHTPYTIRHTPYIIHHTPHSLLLQARDKGLYVKAADGKDFEGWCWPGESSYLDFTDSGVRDFWAEQFRLEKYEGSTMGTLNVRRVCVRCMCLEWLHVCHIHTKPYHNTHTPDLYTWNDMNEPSVFNGPEVSMPKTALNKQGQEHREWHNLYGLYMQMASVMGQVWSIVYGAWCMY